MGEYRIYSSHLHHFIVDLVDVALVSCLVKQSNGPSCIREYESVVMCAVCNI